MNIPSIVLKTGRAIGNENAAYIIAEIGSNHDGDLERAKRLIRLARDAGADAAKFQSFRAERLINSKWRQGNRWVPDPSWETLKKLSIPEDWHKILVKEAKSVGIDFLSTPFDLERLQLLIDMQVPAIKIASGDLTYHEMIRAAGKICIPVFLSTGHATLGEVEAALKVLWEVGCKDIVLLHCASLYPASYEEANIRAMVSMQHGFQTQVGYSDHTLGFTAPLGAVALGACVIEKHITDDKTRKGPDHSFALDGDEFAQMVSHIRQLEKALKGWKKTFNPREAEERILARRAIYAVEKIPRGVEITRERVKMVRHAYPEGISPDYWSVVEGKVVSKDIEADELITWDKVW